MARDPSARCAASAAILCALANFAPIAALGASSVSAGPATITGPAGAYTVAQAARGAAVYSTHCAACHGDGLAGGIGPALSGALFNVTWGKSNRTVADLYYVIRTSMPRPQVGSLTESQNLDVVAYLLERNGVAAGSRELSTDTVKTAALELDGRGGGATSGKKDFLTTDGDPHPVARGPSVVELKRAATRDDWLYHNHDLAGTRYSQLAQITRANVAHLQVACLYQLGSDETFVTGPIVYAGTMYVTTAKLTVALDAATCRERWRYKWQPQDAELWPNNRGVAIADGYVVRGTSDGYLLALDAADGRLLWARQVARPSAGETITMPPIVYDGLVVIGPAGSENGIQGWIGAFSLADGSPRWRFNTVPKAGEPGFETWAHDPAVLVGGGAIWSPMSLDVEREELYVPVTNPSPVYSAQLRQGANLYTDSLVALDLRSGKLRWYAQIVPSDEKDWDVTQVSPLLELAIGGRMRRVVVEAGKDGIVRLFDRDTHERLHETAIGTRLNATMPITAGGTRYCPGDLGGIEWNGPAWYPATHTLYVPTVDWCTTTRSTDESAASGKVDHLRGTDTMDNESHGLLTAIDATDGRIRWQYRSAKPMVAGVTTTAGGLVLTGENTGDFIALDADDGRVLFRFNTGGAMTAGVVTYAVGGTQYVGVAGGKGSFWFGEARGAPTVIVFRLAP